MYGKDKLDIVEINEEVLSTVEKKYTYISE
jgi:hypothetical protein